MFRIDDSLSYFRHMRIWLSKKIYMNLHRLLSSKVYHILGSLKFHKITKRIPHFVPTEIDPSLSVLFVCLSFILGVVFCASLIASK